MLHCLDKFITKASLTSPQLRLDFESIYRIEISRNNGLFCNQGLTGMLVVKDIDSINKMFPFLGNVLNGYCGNENTDVTRTYTSYVDMVSYLYRKCELIG